MLSIGASYAHLRLQQDILEKKIKKQEIKADKITKSPGSSKIHPAGDVSAAKKLASGDI